MSTEDLNKLFKKSADSVVYSWPGVVEADDLAQELWLWYLGSPAVQAKISESDYPLAARLTTMQAHRIASVKREANARFSSQIKYSAEDIKNALSGETLWSELIDDMTAGLDSLRIRNPDYAAAIEARYLGHEQPKAGADRTRLSRAVTALAEETNRVLRQKFDRAIPSEAVTYEEYSEGKAFRTLNDGPGSKRRVFPEAVNNSQNIFDSEFNGIPGIDMYRSWVQPEMYPRERPARIETWHENDREDCWSE